MSSDATVSLSQPSRAIASHLDAISIFDSKLTVSYTPVPEPASLALMGSGLLGLGAWRRYGAKRGSTTV